MTKHLLTLILVLPAIIATAGPIHSSIEAGKELASHDKAMAYASAEYAQSMAVNISIDCDKADWLGLVAVSDSVVYDCGMDKFAPAIDYVRE